MRAILWAGAAGMLLLAGCQKAEERADELAGGKPGHRGRFVGAGIYTPHRMWSQLTRPASSPDSSAATLEDDEQVIVVVDTATGEIRQCGNLSGHCLSMNPWAARREGAPVLKHALQLDEEAQREAERMTEAPGGKGQK